MATANPTTDKILTPLRPGAEPDPLAPLAQQVEHARERVGEVAQRAKERVLERERQLEGYVREHPIQSLLVAAGVGAGVGLLIGALLGRR